MSRLSLVLGFSMVISVITATAQEKTYATYKEAAAAGAKELRAGNLPAARAPLEAAAKLAGNDREKIDAHRTLLVPYRELTEIEPMQQAAEVVIALSPQYAERSLTRSALLSFIKKRGKLDAAMQGYEERLKKNANDETMLFLLAEGYANRNEPAKAVEAGERLMTIEEKAGKPVVVMERAKLADQYARAGKPKAAAEMYEKIAPLEKGTEAWHWKEAAAAWLKDGNKEKALAAARKSAAAAPDARSEMLTYFWRRGLGDTLLNAGSPGEAVVQFEKALAVVKIDGYKRDTEEQLAKAKAAAAAKTQN